MALSAVKRCVTGLKAQTCVILGSQWGDEGIVFNLIFF